LTTPQALRELQTQSEAADATRQVETLQQQLKAIEDVDRADFAALERLGFGRDGQAAITDTGIELAAAGDDTTGETEPAPDAPATPGPGSGAP
jgi:hypothetical protein